MICKDPPDCLWVSLTLIPPEFICMNRARKGEDTAATTNLLEGFRALWESAALLQVSPRTLTQGPLALGKGVEALPSLRPSEA